MALSIDINCDLGEGCENDAELMRYISSANIACGFHAGNTETMKRTVELALANNVAIGAHPSFPDRENFGRTEMSIPYPEVSEIVAEQIILLKDVCDEMGARLHHVKPHGALYNMAVKDRVLSRTIANTVSNVDNGLLLFGMPNSFMISEAEACGLRSVSEVFADRTYQPDGTLTPRSQPHALIDDVEICKTHVLRMVQEQNVIATDGSVVPIKAETICIHGDGARAVEFAAAINRTLRNQGIEISPN
ncbi:MAG: 5-oxoprolinase subunit PxpA, partial [Pyrinomonadaceae bacterium]